MGRGPQQRKPRRWQRSHRQSERTRKWQWGEGPVPVGGTALRGGPPLDRTCVIINAHCFQKPSHPTGYKGLKCAKCLTTAQTSPEIGGRRGGGRRRRPRSPLSFPPVSVGTEPRRASCWSRLPSCSSPSQTRGLSILCRPQYAAPAPCSLPKTSTRSRTLNRTGSRVSSCCPEALLSSLRRMF